MELTIPQGTSEQDALQRIRQARGNAEPTPEPTEEPDIVDVSSDTPDETIDEAEELHEVAEQPEEVEEVEELAETETPEEDEFYLDLDGEEIPLSQVREWKSNGMMQADYTRKTTELAEQRKELDSKSDELMQTQQKLNELTVQLESLVSEGELTPEEVKELREYEPDEYIKYIERQQVKKDALTKAKANVSQSNFDPATEQQKLFNANPQWLDNGKPTDAYQKDTRLINDYASKQGITPEKFATFDAGMIQMMLDAARFNGTKQQTAQVTKKVRKAPVITKPKQAAKQGAQAKLEEAQKRFKKNPTDANAVALRKLKRQLNK